MKVLIIGGGGREHTLAWKICQSPKVKEVYCAPGNAGIAKLARCVDIKPEDIQGLKKFAAEKNIDLTVVGPELPLVLGIVDEFEKEGLRIFGPNKDAARIEGSKAFAKAFMKKYGIPTASFEIFSDAEAAKAFASKKEGRVVVKADGLAAGKGAIPCRNESQAHEAIQKILTEKIFGKAGDRIIIEDFLEGEEASFMVLTDGNSFIPLATSQDHKPLYDGDKGPNTGGMGAYSPTPFITGKLHRSIQDQIITPTIQGLKKEGKRFKGIIYAGLMITGEGPKVLEFNVRFGDPEAQPVLMRMRSDLVELLEAVIEERLEGKEITWDGRASCCVVMASKGYPGKYEKGFVIEGLEEVENMDDVYVFHAGTAEKGGKILTDGGRVLGVTALGQGLEKAISRSYEAVAKIYWDGAYFRTDIGKKALVVHKNASIGD